LTTPVYNFHLLISPFTQFHLLFWSSS